MIVGTYFPGLPTTTLNPNLKTKTLQLLRDLPWLRSAAAQNKGATLDDLCRGIWDLLDLHSSVGRHGVCGGIGKDMEAATLF